MCRSFARILGSPSTPSSLSFSCVSHTHTHTRVWASSNVKAKRIKICGAVTATGGKNELKKVRDVTNRIGSLNVLEAIFLWCVEFNAIDSNSSNEAQRNQTNERWIGRAFNRIANKSLLLHKSFCFVSMQYAESLPNPFFVALSLLVGWLVCVFCCWVCVCAHISLSIISFILFPTNTNRNEFFPNLSFSFSLVWAFVSNGFFGSFFQSILLI